MVCHDIAYSHEATAIVFLFSSNAIYIILQLNCGVLWIDRHPGNKFNQKDEDIMETF